MGTRVKWFHVVLISIMIGTTAGDELLMKSSASASPKNKLVVREGTDISLTCYTKHGSSLFLVRWSRGSNIGGTRFDDPMKNCSVERGQIDDSGGQTQFSCNKSSSTIVIQGVLKADSKEWTCLSEKLGHRSITLEVESVFSSMSTLTTSSKTTTTTTTTTELSSTPESTTQLPAITSTSGIEVTNELPTATSGLSSSFSREQTTVEQQTEMRGQEANGTTQLYIILPSTLGGAATLVLCVFLAWRTRTSRKRNVLNGSPQKKGADSQEDILEMQDNPVYWTSNNATVDSIPQLKDKDEKENPFYWTIEPSSTDHPTQVEAEDEQANRVYWTIEPDTQGSSQEV